MVKWPIGDEQIDDETSHIFRRIFIKKYKWLWREISKQPDITKLFRLTNENEVIHQNGPLLFKQFFNKTNYSLNLFCWNLFNMKRNAGTFKEEYQTAIFFDWLMMFVWKVALSERETYLRSRRIFTKYSDIYCKTNITKRNDSDSRICCMNDNLIMSFIVIFQNGFKTFSGISLSSVFH